MTIPALAVLGAVEGRDYGMFAVTTLGFLVVSFLILWRIQQTEMKLTLLGLVVAVAGIGYGLIAAPGGIYGAILLKIALILVLAGVACALLPTLTTSESGGSSDDG